ncbi:type I-G CRISPR-associated RAMP protein Csb1/Cas7g [Corynebacterium freiburgense]|uniref:type I-G CRISPR-associated RAMP protein Csb1/Cas7g n=1 Tax=Corynebacterium freiburgense TaxID=556548 RepID=UPI0004154AF1|nr:type I-U CRISPR-associated RAMP protein Csb1/Cas7u [Corynebacterium freiburgense]WJZ03458.1 CRISPR-associated protein [Corynebacterium freiburgense]
MLTFQDLIDACTPGGASVLTSVTELEAAAGPHASVAPAKFVDRSNSVFAFETRFVDGEPKKVALLDSKQSQLNRCEDAFMQDVRAGHPLATKVPRIEVEYKGGPVLSDMELPHRFADGHIRAGKIDGEPATAHEKYRAVRNCTAANYQPLLNTAPAAALLGAWDSSRPHGQVRLRSALVGEIIGVLADQEASPEDQQSKRGGARVDSIAMSVRLEPSVLQKIVDDQKSELSPGFVEKISEEIKKAKKDTKISASGLGLGGIPPQLEALGGVSCSKIIRSWVLSFATLRQLRFGQNLQGDIAGRALLAALALSLMARAERELYLRANCDLVETSAPKVMLDQRFGEKRSLEPITVEAADALLEHAIEYARELGVADWNGQVLEVVGNPAILSGADNSTENGQ